MLALKRIFLVTLLLLLASCAKPVPPEKSAYVGLWKAPSMELLITQEGRINYKRTETKDGKTINKSIDSPIKAFRGDDFEVGIASFTTMFVVSKTPHQVDGKWKMENGKWKMENDGRWCRVDKGRVIKQLL